MVWILLFEMGLRRLGQQVCGFIFRPFAEGTLRELQNEYPDCYRDLIASYPAAKTSASEIKNL